MSQEKQYSDEFLNAFVDDQLAAEEKARAYIVISGDEALNRQVCELRKLHDLVQLAYRDLPTAPDRQPLQPTAGNRWRAGIAASVLLALGVTIGLSMQSAQSPDTSPTVAVPSLAPPDAIPASTLPRAADTAPARRALASATATPASSPSTASPSSVSPSTVADRKEPIVTHYLPVRSVYTNNDAANKVLIHIAHDDSVRLGQALEEIEGLMRHYRDGRLSAHVEVVINGRGLELVQTDTSRHASEIARLQKEYDNLTFAACLNTIERLQREQGIHVRLLPGVVVIDSGMAEIMRRQNQGWAYLQV